MDLTLIIQHFSIHVDIPLGRKYFFSILKRICALIVTECYFGQPLSELHQYSTAHGLYNQIKKSCKVMTFKRDNGSKRSILTDDITIYSEFPTVRCDILPLSNQNTHQVKLTKKDTLRGSLIYNYTFSMEENKIYSPCEINLLPKIIILERQNPEELKPIMKTMIHASHPHSKFQLDKILKNVKLSTKSNISSHHSLTNYSDWLSNHHPNFKINYDDEERDKTKDSKSPNTSSRIRDIFRRTGLNS